MKKEDLMKDPFVSRIEDIMHDSRNRTDEQDFRSLIRAVVRDYSQLVSDAKQTSTLFFRLCDLLVDCQSASLTEPAFRLVVASLFFEHCFTKVPSDENLKELTGFGPEELSDARSVLMNQECLISVMRDTPFTGIGGKKVARKKKIADLEVSMT